MDKTCRTCHGKGPVPQFRMNERGGVVPLPFVPCAECGLAWPTEAPLPSPSFSSLVSIPYGQVATLASLQPAV